MTGRDRAIALWQAGVDAVGGYESVARALKENGGERPDRILAVGKAAGSMTRAALDHYGHVPALVVTKDGHGEGLPDGVELIESSHPVPDARSLKGGRALVEAVETMRKDSRLLLLVSGGASALAEDLVEGKTLDDLAALNRQLLASGKDIGAINVERRRISRVKGGGLLSRFGGASVRVLAISDVPGDDLMVIGSGIGAPPETPAFEVTTEIVASNAIARAAAVAAAETEGLAVLCEEEALHDDYLAVAAYWGPRIRDMAPGVIVLGGEPTVVLPDEPGEGGRNQALALALAREIAGKTGITIVVGGTDGSDGPTNAAGGVVDGTTWEPRAAEFLTQCDSGSYLAEKGALLTTGPTGTNVMDLVIALKLPSQG